MTTKQYRPSIRLNPRTVDMIRAELRDWCSPDSTAVTRWAQRKIEDALVALIDKELGARRENA